MTEVQNQAERPHSNIADTAWGLMWRGAVSVSSFAIAASLVLEADQEAGFQPDKLGAAAALSAMSVQAARGAYNVRQAIRENQDIDNRGDL